MGLDCGRVSVVGVGIYLTKEDMMTIWERWCVAHDLDSDAVISIVWWRWVGLVFVWVSEGEMVECAVRWPVFTGLPEFERYAVVEE